MIFDRSLSRRSFAIGSAAAAGAGMAAIALTSCSSSENHTQTGEPQVVTDSSLIISVLDGDYEYTDATLTPSATWTLPLGTLLFHAGNAAWSAAMLTPESAAHINTLGALSLSSGNLVTVKEDATQGSPYTYFDVRCSDSVFAWIEINYTDRSWALFGQQFADGSLAGDPVKLDEGDENWEPPRITVHGDSVIWQRMPLSTGSSAGEDSHCYIWSVGADEGIEVWTSHGRFATTPRVSGNVLTITPRVREDEGTYYGLTALDLTSKDYDQVDQLVMPSPVARSMPSIWATASRSRSRHRTTARAALAAWARFWASPADRTSTCAASRSHRSRATVTPTSSRRSRRTSSSIRTPRPTACSTRPTAPPSTATSPPRRGSRASSSPSPRCAEPRASRRASPLACSSYRG